MSKAKTTAKKIGSGKVTKSTKGTKKTKAPKAAKVEAVAAVIHKTAEESCCMPETSSEKKSKWAQFKEWFFG